MSKSADAFRTISEVADWLGVQPHVLRFWESKFTQVKPVKRAGGRRYYRPADMQLLDGLRKLLHDDGLTIKGAQKVLREEGMAYVASLSKPLDDDDEIAALAQELPEAPAAQTTQPIEIEAELPPTIEEALAAPTADETARATGQVSMFDDTTAPRVPVQEADPVVLSDDAPEDAAREPDLDAGEMTSDAAELPSFVTDAPAPNLTVVETAPEIGVTEQPPAFDASHAPEPEPEPEVIEEAPMAVDVDPEPEDAALPAFLHPAPAKEASDTEEPAADPIDAVSEQDIRTAPELPSFTRSTETPEEEPTLDAPEPQDSAPDPFETAPQELAQEDVPEPAAASLVVDAPDPVDAELVAKPAAMSAAIRTKKLTPEQRSAILPLVARLAAHRDQLAAGGAQSGWL